MCNGFGIDGPEVVVVIGVCVVFSPLIVTGLIVGGAGYAATEGARAVRTTNLLRKVRKRYVKRLKAGEWQAYLQDVHDRAAQDPTAMNLHELGVAMLCAEDPIKAEEYLSAAYKKAKNYYILYYQDREAMVLCARILFARGLANQTLCDYHQAEKDFEEAAKYLEKVEGTNEQHQELCEEPAVPTERKLPEPTREACLNSLGYSLYLRSLYSVMQSRDFTRLATQLSLEGHLDLPLPGVLCVEVSKFLRSQSTDLRVTMAADMLQKAIKAYDEAIRLTEAEPRGMFIFNRGKAKYYLALLGSMPRIPVDGEEPAETSINMSALDQKLMTEALADFEACVGLKNFGTAAEGHAMRAQALAVLERHEEAVAAAAEAKQRDPRVFLVSLSSQQQLLTPWPLPPNPQGDQEHEFEEKRLFGTHFCDHCLQIVPGFTTSACCQRCDFLVHRSCLEKVKKLKTCWCDKLAVDESPASGEDAAGSGSPIKHMVSLGRSLGLARPGARAAPAKHVHSMAYVHFHKPTWCDSCGHFIMVPAGYTCTECHVRCHTSCLDQMGGAVIARGS